MDASVLSQVLTWVISSGGAMALAYFLMEKVTFLANLTSEAKRYVSLALGAGLAMGAFTLSIFLNYYPSPTSAQEWIETLFSIAFLGVGGSQIIHGRVKLHNS